MSAAEQAAYQAQANALAAQTAILQQQQEFADMLLPALLEASGIKANYNDAGMITGYSVVDDPAADQKQQLELEYLQKSIEAIGAVDPLDQQAKELQNAYFQRAMEQLDANAPIEQQRAELETAYYEAALKDLQDRGVNTEARNSLEQQLIERAQGILTSDSTTNRTQLESDLLDRARQALSGELPDDPMLLRDLEQQRQTLEDDLRSRLGPGYDTSSAGIEALARFDEQANLVLDQSRRTVQQTSLGDYAGISGLNEAAIGSAVGGASNLANLSAAQLQALTAGGLNLGQLGLANLNTSTAGGLNLASGATGILNNLVSGYGAASGINDAAIDALISRSSGIAGLGMATVPGFASVAGGYGSLAGGYRADRTNQDQIAMFNAQNSGGGFLGGIGQLFGTLGGAYLGGPGGASLGKKLFGG